MATFTMALKRAIEITGGTTEVGEDGITRLNGGNIGLGHNFPIHDPEYRPILVGKIVDHYWNREIGMETVDMFQLAMRRKMNEIMPIYTELYKSTQLDFDPMKTVNVSTINNAISAVDRTNATNATTDNTNTSSSNTTSNATSRTIQSDFPQTMLNGSGDYASAGADASSATSGTAGGTETGQVVQGASEAGSEDATTSGDSTTSGYQGIPADILVAYRQSLINIDTMIIAELEDLFMIIWDNGDSYTLTNYNGWGI